MLPLTFVLESTEFSRPFGVDAVFEGVSEGKFFWRYFRDAEARSIPCCWDSFNLSCSLVFAGRKQIVTATVASWIEDKSCTRQWSEDNSYLVSTIKQYRPRMFALRSCIEVFGVDAFFPIGLPRSRPAKYMSCKDLDSKTFINSVWAKSSEQFCRTTPVQY